MNNSLKIVSVCAAAALLAACQPKDKDMDIDSLPPADQQASQSQSSTQLGSVSGRNVSGSENNPAEPRTNELGVLVDEYGIPTHRVFYFDYDQASIDPADLDALASHGQYVANSPGARVRLEGHTDERGTREYNIALGENRAKAVERILQLQGVRPSQIAVLSLGEEQPASDGHEENNWALNRRVEIIYEVQ